MLIKDDVNFLVLVISRLKKYVAATNYTGPLKINIKIEMLVKSNNQSGNDGINNANSSSQLL